MGTIKLDHISKIEGHADLYVKIDDKEIKELSLDGVEGARYFEGFLKGRKYNEVHHIVSRICGVCSQSHLLCGLKAIENALHVTLTPQAKTLRKLILYGSILQSHVLHLYFLALPDYLGYESAIAMASKYKDEVKVALQLKKLANDICTTIGGRDVHCVTPVVGGFSKLPSQKAVDDLILRLKKSRKHMQATFDLFASIKAPSFERKTEYVALKDPEEYAFYQGRIVSTEGIDVSQKKYKKVLHEKVKDTSSAKFVSATNNLPFMTGSLARMNLNHPQLNESAKKAIQKAGYSFPSHDPFMNNIAQAVELLHLTDETISLLEKLDLKPEEPVEYDVKAGKGVAALEVPRGTVYHEYELDDNGFVAKANIIAPTTQNLYNIEKDLWKFIPGILDKEESEVVMDIEKLIRAYDPCLSCAAHFLNVEFDRV
ncbi:Ni/Fe hydrogenase subunit alpha [Candidatus Woesearchaeota archaeon]|nr:Ni/Fe hydrogenase subunit alpha [Candidatus Woesearchaeota archaeon]